MRRTYTPHQRNQIAAHGLLSERTVLRYDRDPTSVSELSRLRIERAVRELELPPRQEQAA